MDPLLFAWLELAVCAALIAAAGPELSRSGDVIATKTGLSAGWIGLILLATVTSLPELVTGVTSVTVADTPDIAVGDVFGSCVFNLAILVVLDFLYRKESVYRRAHQGHVLSAAFGVMLIGFAGLNLVLNDRAPWLIAGHIGVYTPVILLFYPIAMRSVFNYEGEHREQSAAETADRYPKMTLRNALLRYAVAALVVVAAGSLLPFAGRDVADFMGWRRSFVGTLLVAGVTSLPELVVSVAALRLGALDLAIANLLGSNLFDMLILAIDDIFYAKGPILSQVSPIHAVSAMSAVVMTGIAIVGFFYRPKKRLFRAVGWTGLGLFVMYLLNSYVLFLFG